MSAPRRRRSTAALCPTVALFLLVALITPAAAAAGTPSVAASHAESYVIKSDGTLWVWGGNAFGALGVGDLLPETLPAQLGVDTTWTAIDYDSTFGVLALKEDDELWHWGDPGIPFTPTPVKYVDSFGPGLAGPWSAFAAGDGHLLLIKNDSTLWAWGLNSSGELGVGDTTDRGTPTQIGGATWVSIAAEFHHNLGVQSDGTLWAWGLNDGGQLGVGDFVNRSVPTRIGSATNWKAVFCGPQASYAVKTDGRLYAWGNNDYGQLGIGWSGGNRSTPALVAGTDWANVAPGALDCLAIRTDGSLWAMGYNADGQLGLPADYVYHDTPERIGTATSWVDVACGPYHTLAVTNADEFAACGANHYGQIGLGYPLYRCSPEQVGTASGWAAIDASISHAGGVRADGTLWMWGSNSWGALGFTGSATAPKQVGTENDWKMVACGAYTDGNYTAAVKTNGTLWTWGDNSAGQLGLGDRTVRDVPTQVGTAADWTTVACSDGVGNRGRELVGDPFTVDDHTLALKSDGTLWAWGANDYGQLGLGDTADRLAPQQVGADTDWQSVACGDDYSAARKSDGTLWAWGRNQFGQLGQGDTTLRMVPIQVLTGSGVDTFGAFACGSGRDASHMLAVKTDGTLWGWGNNSAGELGQGLSGFQMYPSPVRIGDASSWAQVACGSSFGDNYSLALTTSGKLWSFGGDFRGQLGNGDYVALYEPAEMAGPATWSSIVAGSNSFAIQPDGTLWAWGDNAWGQLGLGDPVAYSSTAVFPLETFTDSTAPTVTGSVATTPSLSSGRLGTGGWSRVPRTISVQASDGVSGVSRTQISLSGGVSYFTRRSITVKNGDVTVYCRAIDRMGNRSEPVYKGHYKVDTTRPKPSASKVTVTRRKTAVLRYRIYDFSPCTVKIVIKNSRGVVVKRFTVYNARPQAALTKSFTCTLYRGTYRWYVYATDSVGYTQVSPGSSSLYVK